MVLKVNIEGSVDKVCNEEVMIQTVANRKLLCEIRDIQVKFLGDEE